MAKGATQFEATVGEEEGGAEAAGEGAGAGGQGDGFENPKNPEAEVAEPGAEGGEGSDAGAGSGEVGEDGKEGEGTAGEVEGAGDPVTERIQALEAQIAEMKKPPKDGEGGPGAQPDVMERVSLPKFTPQIIEGMAEKFGIPEEARPVFSSFAPAIGQLINYAVGNVVKHFQGEFASSRYDSALGELSKEKGFEDVPALRKGIDEFMGEWDPIHRSNPALLKKAAIYSRGLNAKSAVARATAGKDRGLKVLASTRPAGASPARSANWQNVAMTPAQKSAAKMYPGGEAAYRKALAARGSGPAKSVFFEKQA